MATVAEIISSESIQKETRLTMYKLARPSDPPYYSISNIPITAGMAVCPYVGGYTLNYDDQFAAATMTIELASDTYASQADWFDYNDMARVEERYSNPTGISDWVLKGTFFVDNVEIQANPNASDVSVSLRDSFKLLATSPFEGTLYADKLKIPRKALFMGVDSERDGTDYYAFWDGTSATHTANWCTEPNIKVWTPDGGRLPYKDGSVDVMYGDGMIYIEKDYFETAKSQQGLGYPESLDIEYYRFATPGDVVTGTVAGITTANVLTVSGASVSSGFVGCHMTARSGAGKWRRWQMTGATAATSAITVSVPSGVIGPYAAGVTTGDIVTMVDCGYIDEAIQRVALDAGFQDLSSTGLFYINAVSAVTEQGQPILVPATNEFAPKFYDGVTHQEMLERLRKFCPPNYSLWCDVSGNFNAGFITLSDPVDYDLTRFTKASRTKSDAELYTKVRYRARRRSKRNLSNKAGGHLTLCRVLTDNDDNYGDPISGAYVNASSYPRYGIIGHESLHPASAAYMRAAYAVTDSSRSTYLALRQDTKNSPEWRIDRYNNIEVLELVFDATYTLGEIHVTRRQGVEANMSFEILYSEDGSVWWSLCDEVDFGKEPTKILTKGDFGESVRFKYLRWKTGGLPVTSSKKRGMHKYLVLGPRKTFTSTWFEVSDIIVFEDDIIVGEAELGVDRFNGESDDEFEHDKYLRGVIGERVYDVQGIDEYAEYMVDSINSNNESFSVTIENYAKWKAMQYLAEVSRIIAPIEATCIEPAIMPRQSATALVRRLGNFYAAGCMITSVTHSHMLESSIKLTPYKGVVLGVGAVGALPTPGTGSSSVPSGGYEDPTTTTTTTTVTWTLPTSLTTTTVTPITSTTYTTSFQPR